VEHGVSQIAKRSSGGPLDTLTWNYPLDIMFRSCNVHGWPQLVLGVYGLTTMGGDVVRGYAATHVPTTPGRHTRYVQLYTPVSSSCCQRLTAWLTNNPPEFFDSKFVAQGKGREVTRVRSHGAVKVTFNVTTKNMSEWGYQVDTERGGAQLAAQMQLAQQQQQQQGGYDDAPPHSAMTAQSSYSAGGGGGGISSRPISASVGGAGQTGSAQFRTTAGGGGGANTLGVPPRTQLSASTTAALQRATSSTNNSRENSRRGIAAGSSPDADEFEAKYPMSGAATGAAGGTLSQRPTAAAADQHQGVSQLAPLRQGSRQLQPL
jgi:B9 domain-containing protein 1